MRSVTFGNSFKLSLQKQLGAVQDQRRVQLPQQDMTDHQLDDGKLAKISAEYFDSADRASAKGKVSKILQQQGIDNFIHTGPSGSYLLTASNSGDTVQLYNQVRNQYPELCNISRAREFDDKLIEAGVINPDNNATLNVKYRLNNAGDGIKLSNKPEILHTIATNG